MAYWVFELCFLCEYFMWSGTILLSLSFTSSLCWSVLWQLPADLYKICLQKQSQLLAPCLLSVEERAVCPTPTSSVSRFGSVVAASALPGWLTAWDVSHFRLDSTVRGALPFFSPSPLNNPVLTPALPVTTAVQPFAGHAAVCSLTWAQPKRDSAADGMTL